ncbi:MAG: prolyl oligopeptidase family serine peptidase [Gemmatimonadota bacterium]
MNRGLASLFLTLAAAGTAAAQAPDSDELERTVARLAKIGFCSSPTFSPDGKRLAFVSNMSGSPQVWTIPAEGGFPEMVTAFDDPVGFVEWSPEGSFLAFTLAPGGGMNEQVYLVRPDGTGVKRLTEGGKENNRLGVWSPDGRLLALGSNRRSPAAIDAYVYDVASGAMRLVTENPGVGGFSDITRDGRYALLNRVVSRGDNNLYLVEVASGKETLVTPHEGPGSFFGKLAPDGTAIYVATNKGRDLRAFGRASISGGKPGEIEVLASRDDAEVDGLEVNAQGTLAALVWNVAGRSELELFDLRTGKSRGRPKLPAEIAAALEFSPRGDRLALALSGAAAPTDVWILDVATGASRRITRSPHAGIDLEALVRPELLRFRAHDGVELSGWLYRPPQGRGPFPTVLSFHGGPESQERPGFSSTYQALLARGIAVFAPNVRGSSGFGKKFVNLDNGALRFDGVKDIRASVDAVVAAGAAASGRIGIMGGSYGGYMVMAGLADYPELFAAGANLFGVVNFETFFKHTEPWMAAISKVEYGDPEKQADLLRRLSPIHRVDRVRAATLVLHGANDTNVPVVEAEQVVESLKKRGVPVEYVLFPDEGHGWRKTPNRVRSTVEIVRWFERHLTAPRS